jgi:hypothetical protein
VLQASSDSFWGRYSIPVGQSVVKVDGTFTLLPVPWQGDLADLEPGVDYFLGGRTYTVTNAVATELEAAGFTVSALGYGQGAFGRGPFGG